MTFLHSLRAASVCAAVIVGGASVAISPALAIPISGVTASKASSAEGGPRRPGVIKNTAGPGSGASVAKGRPTGAPATGESPDWLLGMKR